MDEDGLQLTLEVSASNYTITDSSYTVRTFTRNTTDTSAIKAGGILTQITDQHGNKIQFTYNEYGRVTYISLIPKNSTTITFLRITHNASGLVNRILNETTQQAIIFYYSSTYNGTISPANGGFLRKIEYAHQTGSTSIDNWTSYMSVGSNAYITSDASATYTYDSSGHLIQARDERSQYEINYTYSGNKVTQIQEKSGGLTGQKIILTYNNGYTICRSSGSDDIFSTLDDVITRYSFDKDGRTIGSYSSDVYGETIYGATSGSYVQDNKAAKNSIKQTMQTNSVSPNYLLNGGFEQYSYNSTYGTNVAVGSLNNWITSGSVSVNNLMTHNSQFAANLIVSAGTTSSLSQRVFLREGEYTLSMNINTSM